MSSKWIVPALILLVSCTPAPSKPTAATSPIALTGATQKGPGYENLVVLGFDLSAHGRHEEALTAFRRALATSPQSPLALNSICSEYCELKRWRLGIESCQKALELDPGFVPARNNLAIARKLKSLQDSKIAALENDIKAGKNVDRNRVDLGMELYSQGDYGRAVENWIVIPETSEVFAIAQNNLASAYIWTKKFAMAKACLGRALEREPANQLFLNNLNWLQTAMQESTSGSAPQNSEVPTDTEKVDKSAAKSRVE